MSKTKVLVVNEKSLLGAGILALLQSVEHVNAFGTSLHEFAELLKIIDASRPDIVLLPIMPPIDSNTQSLLGHLHRLPSIAVAVVEGESNNIEFYSKQRTSITQPTDLFDLFRNT